MGDEVPININPFFPPSGNKAAVFDPQTIRVLAGDLIYWRSNDRNSIHQPKPVGGADNAWVKSPIPTMQDDQPATSNTLSFGSGTTRNGVPYVCALHPGETGTIIAYNLININSKAGAKPTDPQVGFVPGKLSVKVNECFIWINNDVNPHWPAPSVDQKTAWLPQQIEPGKNSAVVCIGQPTSGDLVYVCALHPNETGKLNVANPST
jgi:plastocyanin